MASSGVFLASGGPITFSTAKTALPQDGRGGAPSALSASAGAGAGGGPDPGYSSLASSSSSPDGSDPSAHHWAQRRESSGELSDGEGAPLSSVPASIEYKGTTLAPGIEQIQFDEGCYVGTVDLTGAMAGYGKAKWASGDSYEGEWLDDCMHGHGQYMWADGDYYKGNYEKGFMNGFGEMRDATGVYTGAWVNDMRQGQGKMVYTGGNVYEGEWLAGMRHGQGRLCEPATNTTYEGEFVRNEKEGKGVQTNSEGDIFEGEFAAGKPNGRGTYVWADGAKYVGSFKDGVKHGEGCEWLANGDWIAGNFINGEHDHQQAIHKAVGGTNFVAEELPDEISSALQPLDAEKLKSLASAAAALEDGKVIAVIDPNSNTETFCSANHTTLTGTSGGNAHGLPSGGASSGENGGADGPASVGPQEFRAVPSGSADITTSDSRASFEGASSQSFTNAVLQKPMLLSDADLQGWRQLKIIGKGSFGAVYEALLTNGRTVCCKVIELGSIANQEEMDNLRNEIALMQRLHHPNTVQYYGSLEDKVNNTLNIFMELVSGGSLNSFVKKFKQIPMETMRQWAYQMVSGVKYLHECGIVHRDIKGDNVLITVDGIVKLADFGCSKAIDDVCSATHGCSTMVGTPYWMAPEVIKCEAGGYGMKSDVWSIGCTLVEMTTGRPPWPECNSLWAAVYKIANSTGLPTEIPPDLPPDLMDLLEKCFERDARKRPTAAELLTHPFLAEVYAVSTGETLPSQSK